MSIGSFFDVQQVNIRIIPLVLGRSDGGGSFGVWQDAVSSRFRWLSWVSVSSVLVTGVV